VLRRLLPLWLSELLFKAITRLSHCSTSGLALALSLSHERARARSLALAGLDLAFSRALGALWLCLSRARLLSLVSILLSLSRWLSRSLALALTLALAPTLAHSRSLQRFVCLL
jgi:hypothetical protein